MDNTQKCAEVFTRKQLKDNHLLSLVVNYQLLFVGILFTVSIQTTQIKTIQIYRGT